jgi:hypothetical protein
MVNFVVPGSLGTKEHDHGFSQHDPLVSGPARDFIPVHAKAPGPIGVREQDHDRGELQRLNARYPGSRATPKYAQRYKDAKERLELEGYQSDNWVMPGYHHYTVETIICSVSRPGCTVEAVFEQLRRFPAPARFGTPDRKVGVKTGDRSFALGVGMVEHWVGTRLLTNSTIDYQHLLNPGVVIREVLVSGDNIIVKTSGYGTGLLPQINSGAAAKWIWSERTDSNIKAALGIKD